MNKSHSRTVFRGIYPPFLPIMQLNIGIKGLPPLNPFVVCWREEGIQSKQYTHPAVREHRDSQGTYPWGLFFAVLPSVAAAFASNSSDFRAFRFVSLTALVGDWWTTSPSASFPAALPKACLLPPALYWKQQVKLHVLLFKCGILNVSPVIQLFLQAPIHIPLQRRNARRFKVRGIAWVFSHPIA